MPRTRRSSSTVFPILPLFSCKFFRRSCRRADITLTLQTGMQEQSVFSAAEQTARTLKKLAARLRVPVTVEHVAESTVRTPDVQRWLSVLFSRGGEPCEEDAPHIFTHRSESIAEECSFAATYVRRLMQSGVRCREITVAVTDSAAYLPVLRSVFIRAGIPAYFAGTTPLLQSQMGSPRCAVRSMRRSGMNMNRSSTISNRRSRRSRVKPPTSWSAMPSAGI